MTFISTAIYNNRIEDKKDVEEKLKISEEGNASDKFYLPNGDLLCEGYDRIVYGDHGPYLEFSSCHLKTKLFSKFGNKVDAENLPGEDYKYYYFWLTPENNPNIKIYLQIKPVNNLPNAPRRDDGKPSKFNRKEGYADYKRGYFYVDPHDLLLNGK